MALPVELRELLLCNLSALTTERWLKPTATTAELNAFTAWFALMRPNEQQAFLKPGLTPLELQQKMLSWSGLPSYLMQCYLPRFLPVLIAITSHNLSLFLDVTERGSESDDAIPLALQQLSSADPIVVRNTEVMLVKLFHACQMINNNDIIDDILIGRTKISDRVLHMILALPHLEKHKYALFEGFAFARLQIAPAPFQPYSGQINFAIGYVLAGGRDWDLLRPIVEHEICQAALICVNLPCTLDDNGETMALRLLAHHSLTYYQGKDKRNFPEVEIGVQNAVLLCERATGLLPLLPELYHNNKYYQRFLYNLQFILTPTAQLTKPELIQPNLAIIFSRLDLVKPHRVQSIATQSDEQLLKYEFLALHNIVNPVAFAQAATKCFPVTEYYRSLLTRAIFTNTLWETAAAIVPKLLTQVSATSKHYPLIDTLEFYQQQRTTRVWVPIFSRNSYLLQTMLARGLLRISKSKKTQRGLHVVLAAGEIAEFVQINLNLYEQQSFPQV